MQQRGQRRSQERYARWRDETPLIGRLEADSNESNVSPRRTTWQPERLPIPDRVPVLLSQRERTTLTSLSLTFVPISTTSWPDSTLPSLPAVSCSGRPQATEMLRECGVRSVCIEGVRRSWGPQLRSLVHLVSSPTVTKVTDGVCPASRAASGEGRRWRRSGAVSEPTVKPLSEGSRGELSPGSRRQLSPSPDSEGLSPLSRVSLVSLKRADLQEVTECQGQFWYQLSLNRRPHRQTRLKHRGVFQPRVRLSLAPHLVPSACPERGPLEVTPGRS
jgi:hypothetical protein